MVPKHGDAGVGVAAEVSMSRPVPTTATRSVAKAEVAVATTFR